MRASASKTGPASAVWTHLRRRIFTTLQCGDWLFTSGFTAAKDRDVVEIWGIRIAYLLFMAHVSCIVGYWCWKAVLRSVPCVTLIIFTDNPLSIMHWHALTASHKHRFHYWDQIHGCHWDYQKFKTYVNPKVEDYIWFWYVDMHAKTRQSSCGMDN